MCEDDQGERIAAACVIAQLGRESEIDEYKRRFRCEGRPSFFLSWRNWSTLRSTFPSFTHASAKRMNSHRGYWKVSCYGRHRDSLGPTKLGLLLGILRDFSLSLRVYVFASHGSLKIIRRENDGSKKKQNVSDEKKEKKRKREKILFPFNSSFAETAVQKSAVRAESPHTPTVNGYKPPRPDNKLCIWIRRLVLIELESERFFDYTDAAALRVPLFILDSVSSVTFS